MTNYIDCYNPKHGNGFINAIRIFLLKNLKTVVVHIVGLKIKENILVNGKTIAVTDMVFKDGMMVPLMKESGLKIKDMEQEL